VGHSLGGITATETAARDDRFKAVVALSHANPYVVDQINVPIQIQCGDSDLGLYSIPIGLLSYIRCNSPKELIAIKFGTHFGFTRSFNDLCPCPNWQKDVCLHYLIGWFDFFLKNDTNAFETISDGCAYLSKYLKSRYDFGDVEKEIY
jgi:pimeloyl-ACP methyl ester carboxylesterase